MSTPDAPPPESGPLSVDEAVELLAGPQGDPDDADEAEVPPPEAEEEDEPEAELAAPHFWSAEDKAAFAELPAHLQEKIAAYEKNRDATTARVIQEAAEARNRAAAEEAQLGALKAQLSVALPQAQAAFAARWGAGEPDWLQVAQTHGPEEAGRLKQQFDQDAASVLQIHAAQQQVEARDFSGYVEREFQTLKGLQPELADPVRGAERRHAVTRFLAEEGFPAEQIRYVGARELAVAYDAMRYRQATSGLARSARAPAPRPGVQPAAALPQRSSQYKRAESAKSRFAAKPTIDNAVAAIMAKG
jgi:hypothetical protein